MNATLQSTGYVPFVIDGAERPGRWCVTCDHAANTVPPFVNGGDLGLSPEDMDRHIAFDPGTAGLARALGRVLDSPVILSNFSRLVIDPNRGTDDPTLLRQIYDGSVIPANRHLSAADLKLRRQNCYDPYHAAVGELAARPGMAILAVHSFTPQLAGQAPRPWHMGVLSAGDRRIADPLLDSLRAEGDLIVGDNEPYTGHLAGDTVDRHALQFGRPNALLELRNDLIGTTEAQIGWANRLAPMLETARAHANL